jgi:hypothetical protein
MTIQHTYSIKNGQLLRELLREELRVAHGNLALGHEKFKVRLFLGRQGLVVLASDGQVVHRLRLLAQLLGVDSVCTGQVYSVALEL